MMGIIRGAGLAIGVVAFGLGGPAGAQENFDQGKTGAQLFASDCGICHKSPLGLAKAGGIFGLSGFLREHYTASREAAGVIAAYLQSLGNEPAPAKHKRAAKRPAKGDEKSKIEEKQTKTKSSDAKSGDGKLGASATPANAKTSEPKTSAPTNSEGKSGAIKPKAKDAKPSGRKPVAANGGGPKPGTASAAKPGKPEKSN